MDIAERTRILDSNQDGKVWTEDFAPSSESLASRGVTQEQFLDAAESLLDEGRRAAAQVGGGDIAAHKNALDRAQQTFGLVQGLLHPRTPSMRSDRRAKLQNSALYNLSEVFHVRAENAVKELEMRRMMYDAVAADMNGTAEPFNESTFQQIVQAHRANQTRALEQLVEQNRENGWHSTPAYKSAWDRDLRLCWDVGGCGAQ